MFTPKRQKQSVTKKTDIHMHFFRDLRRTESFVEKKKKKKKKRERERKKEENLKHEWR